MKKLVLFTAMVAVAFSGGVIARSGFPDVPSNAWFHQYVMEIKDWGVVNGNDDGTFAPGRNITRAEFSKMLSQYDKRVDEKIASGSGSSASAASSSGNLPSVMYLSRGDWEPANCPSGWNEVNYARQWEAGAMERICMTPKMCRTVYIDAYNKDPNACPSGWTQADYGEYWTQGGQGKMRRTCYICS